MSTVLERATGIRGGLLTVAAAFALLSLGLPWGSSDPGRWTGGFYSPGFCSTVYDGNGWASTECGPGFYSAGIHLGGGSGAAGYRTCVRVFLLIAAVLLIIGLRRRSGPLPALAAAVLTLGWLLQPGAQSGQIAYLLALAALVTALHRKGRLPAVGRLMPAGRSLLRPRHGSGPDRGHRAATPGAPHR